MPRVSVGFALKHALNSYFCANSGDGEYEAQQLGVTVAELKKWKRWEGHFEFIDPTVKKKLKKLCAAYMPTAAQAAKLERDYYKQIEEIERDYSKLEEVDPDNSNTDDDFDLDDYMQKRKMNAKRKKERRKKKKEEERQKRLAENPNDPAKPGCATAAIILIGLVALYIFL